VSDTGLRKSIYNKKQLDEFAAFQDSQGMRRAHIAETAGLNGRNDHREWGLVSGMSFKGWPCFALHVLFTDSVGRIQTDSYSLLRVAIIMRYMGCTVEYWFLQPFGEPCSSWQSPP
jgi:hypothetical protein